MIRKIWRKRNSTMMRRMRRRKMTTQGRKRTSNL
jgi:hypothetical protein